MHVNKGVTQSFTRPGDTTAYASGDLVANSTTAASVLALQLAGAGMIIRNGFLQKSTSSTTAATFRLHLFSSDPCLPAPSNGDNGAIALTAAVAGYLGSLAFDMTAPSIWASAGAAAIGTPLVGYEIIVPFGAHIVYALLEARGSYTPGNAEVFTATLNQLALS